MIKNQYNDKILLICLIIVSILIHLISINFHPTNFEGAYGQYSDLFNSDNKILYLKSYYTSQFNTYLFSLLGSLINYFVPFIDSFQTIKILSASSYFFLGVGLLNIFRYYNYKYNPIFLILIIFLNSIIFTYGFRAFNDLFAFSLAIFAISRILNNLDNKLIIFDCLILGISIALKSYNLILIIPLLIFFNMQFTLKKINKTIFLFLIILIPLIILNIFTKNNLGFILAPKNEDLQIAIFGSDETRNIYWVLNNFVFYIGYLTLISLPFFLSFFYLHIKKNIKIIFIFLFISLILSFFVEKFFFISSELDLGPLQSYIPDKIYKTLIIFLFSLFLLFVILFFNKSDIDHRKLNICKTIIFTIIIYLFALSMIKASQRYLILPLPFMFLILFTYKQPKFLIFLTLFFYMLINSLLFTNYYIVGKSTEIIYDFLKVNKILDKTLPNIITPNVHHLYTGRNKIKLKSSDFKITYFKKDAFFTSKINLFGYEIKKYSVIKLSK